MFASVSKSCVWNTCLHICFKIRNQSQREKPENFLLKKQMWLSYHKRALSDLLITEKNPRISDTLNLAVDQSMPQHSSSMTTFEGSKHLEFWIFLFFFAGTMFLILIKERTGYKSLEMEGVVPKETLSFHLRIPAQSQRTSKHFLFMNEVHQNLWTLHLEWLQQTLPFCNLFPVFFLPIGSH